MLKTGYVYTRRAAAHAIASIIPDNKLSEENIIPNVFNPQVVERESEAVAKAAI